MALTRRVALLRAVNVGGRKLVMAALRQMLADIGLESPGTLLQSGNAVFGSAESPADLEPRLEREIASRFGLATDAFVRTADEWRAIIAANPHGAMARSDPGHLVVMALRTEPGGQALARLKTEVKGREAIEADGRELYITYPDGIGDSRLTGAVIERCLGVRGTARNWNTVTKLAAMLD
jgi:uncharacterized protein (DUF1697 family)